MSSDHHAGDLALRSTKTTVNWDFEQSVLLSESSKPDEKEFEFELFFKNISCNTRYVAYSKKTTHKVRVHSPEKIISR